MPKLPRNKGPGHIYDHTDYESLKDNVLSLRWVCCAVCGMPALVYPASSARVAGNMSELTCAHLGLDKQKCWDQCTTESFNRWLMAIEYVSAALCTVEALSARYALRR